MDSVESGVLGISATYLNITGLEKRASNTANSEGSFSTSDFSFSLAYAGNTQGKLFLPFSYGLTLKFIRQSIDQYSADAFAADLGAIAPVQICGIPASFGACIQNIGTSIKYINEEYQLPLVYKFGIAAKPFHNGKLPLLVALDVDFPNDSDISVKIGFEFEVNSMLNIRAGYRNMNSSTRDAISGGKLGAFNNSQFSAFSGLTAGFGLNIPLNTISNLSNGLNLDYAFVPYGELGNTHRISLGMKW